MDSLHNSVFKTRILIKLCIQIFAEFEFLFKTKLFTVTLLRIEFDLDPVTRVC